MDEGEYSAAAKKRTRASKPKVRTGCLTCKIRRVKCGEERPACLRCTSTGRTCDGYDKPAPPRPRPSASQNTDLQLRNAPFPSGAIGAAGGVGPQYRFSTANQTLRLLRPLVADIIGTSEERQFFHRFRTSVAADGLTTHVANRTKFWDEQAPALGHEHAAAKHALVAVGASYKAFLLKRRGPGGDGAAQELEIFVIQQYNKAIAELGKASTGPKENPMRHLEVILFCCLTFITIENLRGNYREALTHLVNGLRIIESELPYSLLAELRGPPGMATTPVPPESVRPNRKGIFGVIGDAKPSPLLLNTLAIFSRYEVSASLFASNIRPTMLLRLYCPTPEGPSLPEKDKNTTQPSSIATYSSPAPSPAPSGRNPDSPFNFPPIGPTAPLQYSSFAHAHFHFTVLAREVYALAYSVQSRRGDESFWGSSLLPPTLNTTEDPSMPTYITPSPSPQAALAQYAVLKSRLAQMYRAFSPFVSGPMAPPPGTKHWRSVRLDLLHMRCCAIHLETLMFRRGAGCLESRDSDHYAFSAARASSSPSPSPSEKTDDSHRSHDSRREQVMATLQRDFAYLITIAEEVQAIKGWAKSHAAPTNLALRYEPSPSSASSSRVASPAPTSAPSPASVWTQNHPRGATPRPMPQPNMLPPNPLDPDSSQFAVDLGVISPMYLAALHVNDRSLRARALVVMRSAGVLEGFWDGKALADLLEKIFAATDDDPTGTGGISSNEGSRQTTPESKGDESNPSQPRRTARYNRTQLLDGVGLTISGGSAIPGLMERLRGMKI